MGYSSETRMQCGRNSTTEKSAVFLALIMASATPGAYLPDKIPNHRKNQAFDDPACPPEWPKVADTVIEAVFLTQAPQRLTTQYQHLPSSDNEERFIHRGPP
jgi:hypothetical protein